MSERHNSVPQSTPNETPTRGGQALFRVAALAIFALSGVAGLIYESLWARYLGLFVGHTAYAQIFVLAIFLGGMSLGALWVGAKGGRLLRDPLRSYAAIETVIGLLGLAFHSGYLGLTEFSFDTLFPWAGSSLSIALLKWSVASLLILPQSVLLGMTFPLMSAGILRRAEGEPGRVLSLLYFSNSLGAAAGTLIAGFFLIQWIGLDGTLMVAGLTNLLVAALSLCLAHLQPSLRDQADSIPPTWSQPPSSSLSISTMGLRRLLFGLAFGTAVASFIYEIGWIRMLSQVLGSASHSFELMLSAFILGLSLGAFWIRSRADTVPDPIRLLGRVQCLMGLAALATLPLYLASFGWMEGLLDLVRRTDEGYVVFSLVRYSMCLAIMLPSTFCAGITLPLITRILLTLRGDGEQAIGRVYGLNTLGSIIGAVTAGLVLLPWLGTHGMIVLGASLDMALGIALLWVAASASDRRQPIAWGTAVAAAAILALVAVDFDPRVIGSGPFTGRGMSQAGLEELKTLFYQEGRTATVAVFEQPNGHRFLVTNGKADASLPGVWFEECSEERPKRPLGSDAATQALAPMVTVAHHAAPRRGAVIGFGSGMSTHFMLASPELEVVETIEIEPEIVRGARQLYPANARAYDDPRSKLITADAKTHFSTLAEPYDVIFSEPSNPWVSGVSNLFTREFYAHVRRSLSEEGVYAQWLHLYEISDDLVLSVMAAIHEVFPAYEVFLTAELDLLIVATVAEALPAPDWSVFELPALRESLCHYLPITPEMMEATRVTHRGALGPLLVLEVQPNTDFMPILEARSERARFLGMAAEGFITLHSERHSLSAPFFMRRSEPSGDRHPPATAIPGMWKLALAEQLEAAEMGSPPLEWHDEDADDIRFRHSLWRAALEAGNPPPSWKKWLAEMDVIEESVHGTRRGAAVSLFYDDVSSYLELTHAPNFVRDVVTFRRGLAEWDFVSVAESGARLVPQVQAGRRPLKGGELLEGLAVAQLQLGDPSAARRTFDTLTALAKPKQLRELRVRLLSAYIEMANRERLRLAQNTR